MTLELKPEFEAVVMPHDAVMADLAHGVRADVLLPAGLVEKLFAAPADQRYRPVMQPDGRPYHQAVMGGELKRTYVFADPARPDDPAMMVAMVCDVVERPAGIVVMPEKIMRGPDADFAMSVRYGCCPGGRTLIYSDTSATKGVFMNIGSSGGDVRREIRNMWQGLEAVVLDRNGMAALAHLVLDMTGRCGHGHAAHASRRDYAQPVNWSGNRPGVR